MLLMVALSARLLSAPPGSITPDDTRWFVLIGFVFLLSIGYALTLRRGWRPSWQAYVQISGDIALATLLITRTGGLESPFAFVYLLAVLAGAVLLGRRGAVFAFVLGSAVLLARTAILEAFPESAWLGPSIQPTSRMAFLLFSNLLGQFLIAWLASYLSGQLQRTGGRLVEREADLSALAALHQQILNAMPSGLITCDLKGNISYLNRAAATILEVSPESAGMQLEALIPSALSIPLGSRRNELPATTPRGRKVLGLNLAALEGTELLLVFQDLTALRETEDALRRADQLAALGKLSAQLAHEIRNPLASMRGSAQLLAESLPEDPTVVRLSKILTRESDRLAGLVEDFLRFARPAVPQAQEVSLTELVAQVVELLRLDPLAQGVRLLENLEAISAEVDPDQLRQVLLNLVRNALQAVSHHGEVRVALSLVGETARLCVWDSAGTIPSDDLPRLFEPFFTRRAGGTGLGLSMAHSIIRAHGGTIKVESAPERGTEVLVMLPLKSEGVRANSGR